MLAVKRTATIVTGLVIWLLLVAVTLSFSPSASSSPLPEAGAVSTPTPGTVFPRPVSEPYTGDLVIFEDSNRGENLQIDRVMDILKITPGKSVADIGAGSGWFTVRAGRRVGAGGKVYAVEINQAYLDHINKRSATENLRNIIPVLGRTDDPVLPAGVIDAVLILKTYHEIGEPISLMKRVRTAMRAGGLVGIIDRNGRGDDHGLTDETVIDEMRSAGFERVAQYDFVKPDGMDYFLVFKPAKIKAPNKK